MQVNMSPRFAADRRAATKKPPGQVQIAEIVRCPVIGRATCRGVGERGGRQFPAPEPLTSAQQPRMIRGQEPLRDTDLGSAVYGCAVEEDKRRIK